jgi:two-component system OmpR family sensor kinase
MSTAPVSLTSGPTRLWNAVRKLAGRMPLRVKLITAVLALVAVALAVMGFAGISFLRGYLISQVDQTLQSQYEEHQATKGVYDYLADPSGWPITEAQTSVSWLAADGTLHRLVVPSSPGYPSLGPSAPRISGPALPAGITSWLRANQEQPVTVPAQSGDGHWRVIGFQVPYPSMNRGSPEFGTVIVGIDVSSIYRTIGRLSNIDAVVSVVVLVVLAMAGAAVVRANLRPLDEIEETAGQIAAGHLDRRVPDHDPRTEIGSLGRSINAMLAQIEAGYRARQESETAARQSEERMRQFIADAGHELRTPLTALRGFAEYYRQRRGPAGLNGGPPGRNGQDAGARGQGTAPAARATAQGGSAAGSGAAPSAGATAQDSPAAPGSAAAREETAPAGPRSPGSLTPEELDRIMQRVEEEAARMGVLVEDLLLLARLDQQRPLDRQPVDMLVLAADAVQDTRMIAPGRPVRLDVERGAAFGVEGDEVRLRQVVGNLMSNALKYTPEGSPIDVRVGSATLSPGTPAGPVPAAGPAAFPVPAGRAGHAGSVPAVFLEVADQGPGLTPEQANRVFERFYRADKARARKTGGSGLGLAIVNALVAAHGGTATVRSAPGQGAAFRITLPLAANARDEDEDEEPGTEGPAGEEGQGTERNQAAGTGRISSPPASSAGNPTLRDLPGSNTSALVTASQVEDFSACYRSRAISAELP